MFEQSKISKKVVVILFVLTFAVVFFAFLFKKEEPKLLAPVIEVPQYLIFGAENTASPNSSIGGVQFYKSYQTNEPVTALRQYFVETLSRQSYTITREITLPIKDGEITTIQGHTEQYKVNIAIIDKGLAREVQVTYAPKGAETIVDF